MTEQPPDRSGEQHPVLAGLVALVGVGLVVGLIMGLVVVAGAQVLGIGGDSDEGESSADHSLYVPRPRKTPAASEPQVTLEPGQTAPADSTKHHKPAKGEKSEKPREQISLSASVTATGPMETFDLTGTYPGGEGAILQVQRFTAGAWTDFPVTASVEGEIFTTGVQTSQPGANRFRVVDTDSDLTSNEVRVTIG